MQKLGVGWGTGLSGEAVVGVQGGEMPLSGGISFLTEPKQKGTVHRSAPQLLYIIFYRFLLRCRTRLIV